MILLVADMQDLKANPTRPAMGTVLEAQLDRGRGPVATVLVQNGTLRVGDFFICGRCSAKFARCSTIAALQVREAEPSMPVEVLGLDSLPEVGDDFQVVTDTAKAKQIVMYREAKAREQAMAKNEPHHARTACIKQMQGRRGQGAQRHHQDRRGRLGRSAHRDAAEALERQGQDPRAARRTSAPSPRPTCCWPPRRTPSSSASTCGRSATAAALAEQEKVDIRLHTIIYELTDEIKKAMTGLLEPVFKEVYKGRAEVRETFRITKVGMRGRLHGDRTARSPRRARCGCCATTWWSTPARSTRCGASRTMSAK